MRKWAIILLILAILSILGISFCFVDVISDEAMTLTSIGETSYRMGMYLRHHHQYPKTLAGLPERPGYANRTTDGWKRPLIYNVDTNGIITIISFGRDGKPGGTGRDKDVARRFLTKNPDGSWCVDDDLWIVKAEINGLQPTAAACASRGL